MKRILFILVLLLLITIIATQWENIRVNLIVLATLKRGIISQNCFWWSINDVLPDSTGAQVYSVLKAQGRFIKLSILGERIYLVTDIQDIKQMLDLSPNPFGPGIFKENFFSTFMPKNVGISVNPEWKYRRNYNDKVLETDKKHHMNSIFQSYIQTAFRNMNPKNFEEFTELTRSLTSKILFGTYEYNKTIYTIFKQADSILSARFNVNTVNQDDLHEYRSYLRNELENPKPNTLMAIANEYHKMLPLDDVIDQIPHWIFPIAGLFSVHLPRLLVLLLNHQDELQKVKYEIQTIGYKTKDNYIRKCILELFRLNNAVNSTFRGLTDSYTFPGHETTFEKGTQFVFFNNPVLRDLFESPNEFIPSRWTLELESSYSALMFNQGNQKCPGKEIVISFITMGLVSYLELNANLETDIKLNPSFIPYILNPCTITFKT
jgi:cytochrome P450